MVDFHDIERLQHSGDWQGTAEILGQAAKGLKAAGAEFLVIATNTMHKVAGEIHAASSLDILHIADPTGEALVEAVVKRVTLLGTRFTIEQDFYWSRLEDNFNLDVTTPDKVQRGDVHRIIYDELCLGVTKQHSTDRYIEIIADIMAKGAEAIILGRTEITMIVNETNSPLPAFDTMALHAKAAVTRALG